MKVIKFFIISIFLMISVSTSYANIEYYGFYPSSLGSEYKEFRHNVLGFSIDIPKNWTFGISNQEKIPVAIIYPKTLNTAKFSANYETIEIGKLPPLPEKYSLKDAPGYVVSGHLDKNYKNYNIIDYPTEFKINGRDIVKYSCSWTSKTGYNIYEYIFFVKFNDEIRTISFRTTFDYKNKQDLYNQILESYTPLVQNLNITK